MLDHRYAMLCRRVATADAMSWHEFANRRACASVFRRLKALDYFNRNFRSLSPPARLVLQERCLVLRRRGVGDL